MNKFNVGDRVVMINSDKTLREPPVGSLGVVLDYSGAPWVCFDDPVENPLTVDAVDYVDGHKDGHVICVDEDQLDFERSGASVRLYKKGDRVRVVGTENGDDAPLGAIGTVIEEDSNCPWVRFDDRVTDYQQDYSAQGIGSVCEADWKSGYMDCPEIRQLELVKDDTVAAPPRDIKVVKPETLEGSLENLQTLASLMSAIPTHLIPEAVHRMKMLVEHAQEQQKMLAAQLELAANPTAGLW